MNKEVLILHNPRCSKSRQTLELLKEWKVEPTIRLYLEDKLSSSELKDVCKKLGIEPIELLRKKEQEVKDYISEFGKLENDDALKLMTKFPKTMERPVVIIGDKAKLGRPPENVLELL